MKNRKFVLLVLIPAFAHILIFRILPILANVVISFMEYNPLGQNNHFVAWANYSKMFSDPVFYTALKNTLLFTAIAVPVNIVLSLTIAALITQLRSNKSRSFFRMSFFLPAVAPLVATSVIWGRSIYPTTNGLLNLIIKSLGGTPVNWIGSADNLLFSVIVFTLWADLGYNIILYSAGMDGIPQEFYEASTIDGAGAWTQFRYMTLPLLGRTTTFVILMTLISYFQMFAQFDVLAYQGGPQNSGMVLTNYIYRTGFVYKDMGYASAIAMVLFLIIMLVSFVQQRVNRVDWEY